MNDDALNLSIRKFLKMVGVTSQREIEHAVARALEARKVQGDETLPATMTLAIPALGLNVKLEGRIELE
jgi:hypothetical protein